MRARLLGRIAPLALGKFARKHVNVTDETIEEVRRRIESTTPRSSPEPVQSPGLGKGFGQGPDWAKSCQVAWMHSEFDGNDPESIACTIDTDSLKPDEILAIVSNDALVSLSAECTMEMALDRLARRICLAVDTCIPVSYWRDAFAVHSHDLGTSVTLVAYQTHRIKYWIKHGCIQAILFT